MGNGFKYIAFAGPMFDEIILFPNSRDHAITANLFGIETKDILGAGFVHMDEHNAPSCYGYSTSLGIKSRGKDDTTLLLRFSAYNR